MTDAASCTSCGRPIENSAISGIFCQSCFERESTSSPGWRGFLNPASALAAGALAASFALHIRLNEVDVAMGSLGAVAVVTGVIGALRAKGSPELARGRVLVIAMAIAALGALQLFRGFGPLL